MGNNSEKPTNNSREESPLHRTPNRIDAGKSNDGNENSIGKPPSNVHTAKPDIGADLASGQGSKM